MAVLDYLAILILKRVYWLRSKIEKFVRLVSIIAMSDVTSEYFTFDWVIGSFVIGVEKKFALKLTKYIQTRQ